MASLIRTKNQPLKWTALYSKIFLYKNNIISYRDLTDKYNEIKCVKENKKVKNIIKKFLIEKHEFFNCSHGHIIEKEQIKIAVNVIVILANIIKSFKLESDTMIKIAQKICYKITGQNDSFKNDNLNLLVFNKLTNNISIKIFLPDSVFKDISNKYNFMEKIFYNKKIYFPHLNENLFGVEIFVCGNCYSLEFNIKNIDKILLNVEKKLFDNSF